MSESSEKFQPRLEGESFTRLVSALHALLSDACSEAAEWGANKALRDAGIVDSNNKPKQ